jgi:hypothetical protein
VEDEEVEEDEGAQQVVLDVDAAGVVYLVGD